MDIRGEVLHRESTDVSDGDGVTLEFLLEFEPLSITAYPRTTDDSIQLDDIVPLDAEDGQVEWEGRVDDWHVAAVGHRLEGLRYISSETVDRYLDLHYEEYVHDLVTSSETSSSVSMNDVDVGKTFTRPFRLDVSDTAQPGENTLVVRVANTLSNHFATETPDEYYKESSDWIPEQPQLVETASDEQFAAGLRGPVTVTVEPAVEFDIAFGVE